MANWTWTRNLQSPLTVQMSDGSTRVFNRGQAYETNSACDMVSFLTSVDQAKQDAGETSGTAANPTDRSSLIAAAQTEGCINNNTPDPVTPDPGTTTSVIPAPPPADGDSGTNQGAPEVQTGATLGQNNTGGPDDGGINPNPAPTEESTRPPNGEPHPTNGGDQPQEQTNAGDPVDIFSGAFYLQETDLTIPNTILPLSFTRLYRSGAASYGPFGWNWDHNFNLFIRELNSGDIALWRNLHEDIFKFDGANFEPPRGVFEKLERVPAIAQVYEINGKGGVVMHFERPAGWVDGERIPLLWISDQHGNELNFTYGSEDKLSEVRDDDDRFFKFEYDECGLLISASDHAGRTFIYEHDEQTMQLMYVKSPAITDHPDGISRIYYYEEPWALPELRHNIIRIEDSEGNVYLENTYDQDPSSWNYARVIEQLYGGFLFQFQYTQLQWVPANAVNINIPALRAEVMNPDFGLETYTFNYRGDLLDRRYRLTKDRSYRVVAWLYEFDDQGNLSKITRPDGSEEINVFDFSNPDPKMRNNLLQKEITAASGFPAPSRIIWKGKYEPVFQQLTEEKNETGIITTYKYDFDITPAALTNTGKLIEIIQPDTRLPDGSIQKAKTTFEYNAKGQLTATVLPDGTRNELKYGVAGDEKSRVVKQAFDTGILNIEHILKYDSSGFRKETIDGNGNSTKQIFNALGLTEKNILPAVNGLTSEYILHYGADKKVILTERPKGTYSDPLVTGNHIFDKFDRDVLGFPVKYILSSNSSEARILEICNDYRGYPAEVINPDRSIIRNIFDERGLPLIEEVIGDDSKKMTSKKVYDRSGKLIQETNPFGLTTKYEYDGFSRVSKIILPNGTEVRNNWLANDLLGSEETVGDDGIGGPIRQLSFKSYTYDEKNRRITETIKAFTDNPFVSTNINTTFFYDQSDRLIKSVDNRGGISAKQYDGLGRLTIEIDPGGNEQHYTYDNNGNLLQTDSHHKEPDGSVSVITKIFTYDERNRKIEIIEPDGSTFTSEYDDRNLLVKQRDYQGIAKDFSYNSFHNRTREIHDAGGLNIIHSWTVDNMSRVTSYTDPGGQISDYFFDTIGRNYKIQYSNGFSSTKTFNDFNQIIKEQLSSGVVFEYTYDSANRISTIINSAFPAPVKKVELHEFSYDGLDRVMTAKAGTNTIFREYDSQGRLLSEKALGNTISCRYNDAAGEVEKIWPDGRTERISHDLNGILSVIEETANGVLGSGNSPIATFKPSGPNAFGEASYQAGLIIKNSYDERKRLTEINVQSPAGINENIKYRYNSADTKQVEALIGQNTRTNYFEFDNRYRLLNAKSSFPVVIPSAFTQAEHDNAITLIMASALAAAHTEDFLYNQSDARTKYSETGNPAKNYLYSPGYKMQTDGTNAYSYHTDGTLQSDGLFNYDIDALGRILTIKSGAGIITEISYDAFGRPSVIKEAGKPVKSFNYLGGFIEQENENGIAARQISLHPVTGLPIAYHSALGTHYTLFESRFNLVGLIDTNGDLLETYRYKSFGLPQVFDSTGAVIPFSAFGAEPIFGGQRYLSATGLYLSKRRLMDPENGVFLSGDPKGYKDSPSLYVYAAQNPINNIDPNGEIIPFIIAAFVIGGALAGAGYSVYDAYHHPERYEGWQGSLRVLGNVFGGAAIAGLAIVGGEAVLGLGGAGIFAAEGTAVTLTASQTFVLYGTSSAVSGSILRGGFNSMFPEYVNPVTPGTIATDYIAGGGIGVGLRGLGLFAQPVTSGVRSAMPTPTTVANGALGEANGITRPGLTLAPETGWLGKLGLQRPIFNPTVDVVANPVGSTYANVVSHEMQHAADMINYPQLSYLANYSRLPGRGIGAFLMETRGYYAEFGLRGLSPSYAWRSLGNRVLGPVTERGYLVAETIGLAALASLPWLLNSSDQRETSHPNDKPPASK